MSALIAAAGLALVSPSAGQVPNTWSGTWVNSAPDGSFWVFTQSGSGQSVGGVWKGNASSGTLSGTVNGSSLSGTLVNNEAGQSASFSITLASDGHSFSGTFTIVGGSTGQWRSACTGGACLSNAAPAPPPGGPPGGGPGGTGAPIAVVPAAKTWGGLVRGGVLPAGSGAVLVSPKTGPDQTEARVNIKSAGDDPRTLASFVPLTRFDCLFAFQGGVTLREEWITRGVTPLGRGNELETIWEAEKNPTIRAMGFIACMETVQLVEEFLLQELTKKGARAAARSACLSFALLPKVRINRAAGTATFRMTRSSKRSPARRLRVSCTQGAGGLTLRIRTRSRRIKLRSVVGPRLRIGVYRSRAATGQGILSARFKR